MHDDLKKRHERAAGDRFIEAYNRRYRTRFILREQRESPDLVYETRRGKLLGLEVATAYYDEEEAKMRWSLARGQDGGPWGGRPDESLTQFINRVLADKCAKSYSFPGSCVLVIDACPRLTDEREIRGTVLPAISVPPVVPYGEIYLGVDLPISLAKPSGHEGQYRIWRLHPPGRRGQSSQVREDEDD